MYMTLLRHKVLYGSETWALRKSKEQHGPVFDSETNVWRKLHNFELQMQFQRPDIVKEITKRRLVWGRHAWR
jgi:hypothetical protein